MRTSLLHGIVGTVVGVSVSLGSAAGAETITGLKPAEPQPTAQQLEPGLAVQYTYAIMN